MDTSLTDNDMLIRVRSDLVRMEVVRAEVRTPACVRGYAVRTNGTHPLRERGELIRMALPYPDTNRMEALPMGRLVFSCKEGEEIQSRVLIPKSGYVTC